MLLLVPLTLWVYWSMESLCHSMDFRPFILAIHCLCPPPKFRKICCMNSSEGLTSPPITRDRVSCDSGILCMEGTWHGYLAILNVKKLIKNFYCILKYPQLLPNGITFRCPVGHETTFGCLELDWTGKLSLPVLCWFSLSDCLLIAMILLPPPRHTHNLWCHQKQCCMI